MTENGWPSDWLRATLTMVVLSVLDGEDSHGYALLGRLRARGLTELKGGTLYPLLARQQEAALVEHRWEHAGSGPGRKVFHLTPEGRAEAADLRAAWKDFTAVIDRILDENGDRTWTT